MPLGFFGPRTTHFTEMLEAYGLWRCSIQGRALLVGLGPSDEYRRQPVPEGPLNSTSLCFLEGPEQTQLVDALVCGPEARTLEHLMVGSSHDYRVKDGTRLRIDGAVAAICTARLPALRTLSLGDMERLFNGHGIFGRLGDVAGIFDAAPRLEQLSLHGNFALSRPGRHATLRRFDVWVQEIGGTEGPLRQETVDNILLSRFPALESMELGLEEYDRVDDYTIPDGFFAANGFPSLTTLRVDCLGPAAEARLSAWKAGRGIP